MPERLECKVLQKARYINTLTFTFYCLVDKKIMSLGVGPEIRCLGVSSRYCCYGNCTAGSEPILKLFSYVIEN